jgi:predicted nucleotidyltransferase
MCSEQGGILMKKALILFALTFMTLASLAGCAPKPVISKVGTASVTTVEPRSATAEVAGRIRVNVTTATVVLDSEGRFVSVNIDVAQNDGLFGVDGVVTTAVAAPTKKEKGDAYGMKNASAIGKEWFEQIAALETWMVGKTLAEVKALPVAEGKITSDLKSSVSVTVTDYMAAVEKAVAAAVELQDVAKVGAESVTTIQPRDATAEVAGRIRVNTTLTGVALDADGKVLHVFIDVAQNDGLFGVDGVVTTAVAAQTKKEKGDAYGMKNASAIGKEWFEQIAALEAWMLGKNLTEVKALPVAEGKITSDLKSSVSVTVTDYMAAFEKAYNAAK